MDSGRFDGLAKELAATSNRRRVLRLLAGGALGALLARLDGRGAAAGCAPHGTPCAGADGRCCSGHCRRRGRCVEGRELTGRCRCRCPEGTTPCGTKGCCGPVQTCEAGRCVTPCVPESRSATCGAKGCGIRENNCGQRVDCGGCNHTGKVCDEGTCRCAVPCGDECCGAGTTCALVHPNGQGVCCASGRACRTVNGYDDCCPLDDPSCVNGGCCPGGEPDGRGNCLCPPGHEPHHDFCYPCTGQRFCPIDCYMDDCWGFCCPEGQVCLANSYHLSGATCCESGRYCELGAGAFRCCGADEADCVHQDCCPGHHAPQGDCRNPADW